MSLRKVVDEQGKEYPFPDNQFRPSLNALRHRDGCRGVFENEICSCGLREARRILKKAFANKEAGCTST